MEKDSLQNRLLGIAGSAPKLPISASSIALGVPEILDNIIACLWSPDEKVSLCAAIRVNGTWFHAAARILWSHVPRADVLEEMPTPRRVLYGQYIHSVEYVKVPEHVSILKDVISAPFTALKELSLAMPSLYRQSTRDEFLNEHRTFDLPAFAYLPTLTSLKLWTVILPENFLELLGESCPQLESLLISTNFWKISAARFGESLAGLTKLRHLSSLCLYDLNHLIMPNLSRLLRLRQLKSIRFDPGSKVNCSLMRRILDTPCDAPFSHDALPAIEHLGFLLPSRSAQMLFEEGIPRTKIRMNIIDKEVDVVGCATTTTSLESLSLNYQQDYTTSSSLAGAVPIVSQSLVALSRLSRLKSLEIRHSDGYLQSLSFTDLDMVEMVKTMPLLGEMIFKIETGITTASLDTIGSRCRQLRHLDLSPQVLELSELGQSTFRTVGKEEILFPRLDTLIVGLSDDTYPVERKKKSPHKLRKRQKRALMSHAPCIREFSLEGRCPFPKQVAVIYPGSIENFSYF